MGLHEGDAIAEFADFYDYTTSYPDEENNDNEERKARLEEEIDLNTLDDSGYELVLPSGAKIGHRSLLRYYRQNLVNDRALVLHKNNNKIQHHYRDSDGAGAGGAGSDGGRRLTAGQNGAQGGNKSCCNR